MSDRRTFLRGLASLPLIGGSVSLIGQPTAAAVPVTDELQYRYLTWLAHEHRAAVREHAYRQAVSSWRPGPNNYDATKHEYGARCMETAHYLGWFPTAPDIEALIQASPTSTRAAVVLSAVGCRLTREAIGA